ncbi:glycosyltransferase [Streptomyces sp. NPDC008313]|uniref:glycosyltransferase n=1 Tax=Streptomyces sp. NPDC008313 TaxID=3364826 RepID=UPI0036F08FCF
MLVGVCDFPGSYAFPPAGYGGIERWLWAVAVGARAAGADVHLLGPGWLTDLENDWVRRPVRLEDITAGSLAERELRDTGYDLLVVGHEYPSLPAWTRKWNELDCDVATFQHSPVFQHADAAFDGRRSRLYCYSPEMIERYAEHQPITELAVHLGLDEEEPSAVAGSDLVWLGRIDEEKAPHLAVRAAQILGRRHDSLEPVHTEAACWCSGAKRRFPPEPRQRSAARSPRWSSRWCSSPLCLRGRGCSAGRLLHSGCARLAGVIAPRPHYG